MPTPIFFKVGVILVRQITKPTTKRLVNYPVVRALCESLGQAVHRFTVRAQAKMLNLKITLKEEAAAPKISPLPESEAVTNGAELLAEMILFTIAASIVVIDYANNQRKEAAKTRQATLERLQNRNQIDDLSSMVEKLQASIQSVTASLDSANAKISALETQQSRRFYLRLW